MQKKDEVMKCRISYAAQDLRRNRFCATCFLDVPVTGILINKINLLHKPMGLNDHRIKLSGAKALTVKVYRKGGKIMCLRYAQKSEG